MSALGARLAAFLLAPEPRSAPGAASPPVSVDGPAAARSRARRPPAHRRVAQRPAPLAAAVLGDAGTMALATDVAALLAQRARGRVAVVAVWAAPAGAPHGSATRATARLAAEIEAATGLPAGAGGHQVLVELPPDATAFAQLSAAVAKAAPVVLAVCGPWPPELGALLAGQELLVGTLAPDAPQGLQEHAVASLTALAPGARALVLPRPPAGLPRALRHRAALRQITAALDA